MAGSGAVLAFKASPGRVVALVALAAGAGAVPAIATLALARFVDDALGRAPLSEVIGAGLLFALTAVVSGILPAVSAALSAYCGRAAAFAITARLYQRVGAEPGLELLERPDFRDRVDLAAEAADVGPAQVLDAGLGILQASITVLSLAAVMLRLSPVAAAIALLGAVPATALERRLVRRRVGLRRSMAPVHRRREAVRALITDPVAGKELRLFGLFDFFHARMLADLGRANDAERGVDRAVLRAQLLIGAVNLATTVVVVVLVVRVHPAAGAAVASIAAFAGLGSALHSLVLQGLFMAEGRAVLAAYDEVVAEPPVGAPGYDAAGHLTRAVTLEDVWFRYGDDLPWVLRGVDLTLRVGEATALVGLNGSGKSTLVKLVCGLYRPTRGAIRWDGVDATTLDPVTLRSRIAAVFQDFTTYDLSAHDNVALGDIERRDDRAAVRRAAAAAGIDATLRDLPAGYDTMLSRMFFADPFAPDTARVTLSGGQWQRVALARTMMRHDRDLMILDEPSAGLDPEAEAEVHHAVVTTLRGTTRLLVTHRLAAVRHADRICVLAGGRITESGHHDELLAAGGGYARLFTLQAAGYHSRPSGSGVHDDVGEPIPATS